MQKDYQANRRKIPTLLFFESSGKKPLLRVELSQLVTSFYIDMQNHVFYTYDHQVEKNYNYNIGGDLELIKKSCRLNREHCDIRVIGNNRLLKITDLNSYIRGKRETF